MWLYFWITFNCQNSKEIFSNILEWLSDRGYDIEFEELPTDILVERLHRFYGETKGTEYAKSSLLVLRAGINHHITGPPFNRVVNIILDKEFQLANKVLLGRIK